MRVRENYGDLGRKGSPCPWGLLKAVPALLTAFTVKVTYIETVFLLFSGDSNKKV